eukprot:1008113-Rhodomonas_salina.2
MYQDDQMFRGKRARDHTQAHTKPPCPLCTFGHRKRCSEEDGGNAAATASADTAADHTSTMLRVLLHITGSPAAPF